MVALSQLLTRPAVYARPEILGDMFYALRFSRVVSDLRGDFSPSATSSIAQAAARKDLLSLTRMR